MATYLGKAQLVSVLFVTVVFIVLCSGAGEPGQSYAPGTAPVSPVLLAPESTLIAVTDIVVDAEENKVTATPEPNQAITGLAVSLADRAVAPANIAISAETSAISNYDHALLDRVGGQILCSTHSNLANCNNIISYSKVVPYSSLFVSSNLKHYNSITVRYKFSKIWAAQYGIDLNALAVLQDESTGAICEINSADENYIYCNAGISKFGSYLFYGLSTTKPTVNVMPLVFLLLSFSILIVLWLQVFKVYKKDHIPRKQRRAVRRH